MAKVQNVPKITNYQSASTNNEFFKRAFAEKLQKGSSRENLLDILLINRLESQSKVIATLLSNMVSRELFVKHHTIITSSPAVEHLFLLRDNMLKLKYTGVSDYLG